jgi:very-short-patch-repair endonuclease
MAVARARHLRKHQTVAERRLCGELRKLRQQGYHFRRQAPIENYIVDFACFSQRLVVELDGIQHEMPRERSADVARDADLTWRGFTVLRFRSGDVSESMEGVLLEILAALGAVEKPVWNGE